jgi:putative sterol carrier protein
MRKMPAILFASAAWVAALKEAINTNTVYRESAKNWEGDFWFIVEPEDAKPGAESERVLIYLDLWHGECREAHLAQSEDEHSPEFRISGTARNWQRVVSKEIDPIRALITNSLKLKGNLAKVMRNVRAAQDLVMCAASIPTEF